MKMPLQGFKTPLQGSLNLVYIKLIKKNCMKTPLQVFLNATIGMELKFYAIFFFFFLSLIRHNLILNPTSFSLKLDFEKIEFQNKDTNLYSFKTGAYCQIFLKIGVKGQNPPAVQQFTHYIKVYNSFFFFWFNIIIINNRVFFFG